MLSTPATPLERLFLPLSLRIPILSLTLSSWQQADGGPQPHTRMYAVTYELQTIFQEKFTIWAEFSLFSFKFLFPAKIWFRFDTTRYLWDSFGPPHLPHRVQGSIVTKVCEYFVSPPFPRQSGSLFFPPPPQLSIYIPTSFWSFSLSQTSYFSRVNSNTT